MTYSRKIDTLGQTALNDPDRALECLTELNRYENSAATRWMLRIGSAHRQIAPVVIEMMPERPDRRNRDQHVARGIEKIALNFPETMGNAIRNLKRISGPDAHGALTRLQNTILLGPDFHTAYIHALLDVRTKNYANMVRVALDPQRISRIFAQSGHPTASEMRHLADRLTKDPALETVAEQIQSYAETAAKPQQPFTP